MYEQSRNVYYLRGDLLCVLELERLVRTRIIAIITELLIKLNLTFLYLEYWNNVKKACCLNWQKLELLHRFILSINQQNNFGC